MSNVCWLSYKFLAVSSFDHYKWKAPICQFTSNYIQFVQLTSWPTLHLHDNRSWNHCHFVFIIVASTKLATQKNWPYFMQNTEAVSTSPGIKARVKIWMPALRRNTRSPKRGSMALWMHWIDSGFWEILEIVARYGNLCLFCCLVYFEPVSIVFW